MNKKISYMLSLLLAGTLFTSCKNGDATFDDYEEGTSVYFAYQYPVRTIVLGDDDYDLTLDHAHKCKILATFGGAREGSDGSVIVDVDPTLVNNLTFEDGSPVLLMPDEYYDLVTPNIWPFNGTFNAGTEVVLTDAFFADPRSVKNTFVIPVVMEEQTGFTRILSGTPIEGSTKVRTDASQWTVQPMDFVLYCVKYQNKYSGYWLTHGTTSIDNIEKAQPHQIETTSMTGCVYHATWTTHDYCQYKRDARGQKTSEIEKVSKSYNFDLVLTFDGNDKCIITASGVNVGSGSWSDDGAKKSWGDKDRDLMELSYQLSAIDTDELGNVINANVQEKLVWQRSGVTLKEFKPTYNN